MLDWEDLLNNDEFEPVHDALCASIKLLESTIDVLMTQMCISSLHDSLYTSNYCQVDHQYFD